MAYFADCLVSEVESYDSFIS